MKAISASIVVLSGSVMVTIGLSGQSDLHKLLFFIGACVGVIGFIGWAFQMIAKADA
jgi:hypothetical protein